MGTQAMRSEDSKFQLFDNIDDQEVTADDSANLVSSSGGLAISVAIEKIDLGLSKVWLNCGRIRVI